MTMRSVLAFLLLALLAHPASAEPAIGPGFDCAKATAPLARLICSNADLSKSDLRFNQAYYALWQQLDLDGRHVLQEEDIDFLSSVLQFCGVPQSGAVAGSPHCVAARYDVKRSEWLARLSGPAREEAIRPIEQHVDLQRELQELGFLPAGVKPDGVYRPATRAAILAWQNAHDRPQTGFISDGDAAVLVPPPSSPLVATSSTPPPHTNDVGIAYAVIGALLQRDGGGLVAREALCTKQTDYLWAYVTSTTATLINEKGDNAVLVDALPCGGGNMHGQFLVIIQGGVAQVVSDAGIGDMSFIAEHIEAEGDNVVLYGYHWLLNDPHCCPSKQATLEYNIKTHGHKLTVVGAATSTSASLTASSTPAAPPTPAAPLPTYQPVQRTAYQPTPQGNQAALLVMGIAGFLVVVAIVAGVIYLKIRADRRHRERINSRVSHTISYVVTKHMRALRRKRFQTLLHDSYGNLIWDPWLKELSYFINTVLEPTVRELGYEEYAAFNSQRTAIAALIDQLIAKEAEGAGGISYGPNLTPSDFEHYCAEQLRLCGWTATTTKASGDQGSDVIAEKDGLRLVVQCKLYNHPVGNKAVQEIAAARAHEQADYAVVVTNTRYTPSAQQLAATNDVLLLHHTDLQDIDKYLELGEIGSQGLPTAQPETDHLAS